jgi:cell division protein FtsB
MEEQILVSVERFSQLGAWLLFLGIALVIALVAVFAVWISYSIENDNLKEENRKLKRKLTQANQELYILGFKEGMKDLDV